MSAFTWIKFCLHALVIARIIEEAIGQNDGCDSALGMQSGLIADSQISASSYNGMFTPPHSARLHNKMSMLFGAWCAAHLDLGQYLHIDLLTVKNISAISSQGLEFSGGHWVSSYSVSYSCDGRVWQPYTLGGTPKIFTGNNDTDSVAHNILPTPVAARMVRIHPVTWQYWGSICMRIELYGCGTKQACRPSASLTSATSPPPSTSTIRTASPSTSTPAKTTTTNLPTTPTIAPTNKTIPACTGSLGMEDYGIKDTQITASTFKSTWMQPYSGRLNKRLKYNTFGSWCALHADTNQYLQVDFKTSTTIVAIATQGLDFPDGNWVTSFSISYSCDGVTWFVYTKNGNRKIFSANSDGITTVKQRLQTAIVTRMVRLYPVTWNAFGDICLRMELYGCNTSRACTLGNISEPIQPPTTTRTEKERKTKTSSSTSSTSSTSYSTLESKHPDTHSGRYHPPTNRTRATKKKNRIVIIYKKIEDDDVVSSSSTSTLHIVTYLLALVGWCCWL